MTSDKKNDSQNADKNRQWIVNYGIILFFTLYIAYDISHILHAPEWLVASLLTTEVIYGVAFIAYSCITTNAKLLKKITVITGIAYFIIKSLYEISI